MIEAGRMVERGTHADLLAAGGRYAELYQTQFDDSPLEEGHAACSGTGVHHRRRHSA